MAQNIYTRHPIRMVDGLPVFSEIDEYVINYAQIAADHLAHLADGNGSPFMVDEQIRDSEVCTLGLMQRYLSAGARILDAGVGTGSLLNSAPVYDRYGVDIALDLLKVAQKRGIAVILAKLAEMPYLDNYFDGVVVCDVLEHLLDLDASVAQIARVLKPGGVLIVRVPNEEDLSSYIVEDRYKYVHVRSFNRNSLRLYLEKCFGFEFVESEYAARGFYSSAQLMNPPPAIEAEIRRVLPPMLKSAENGEAPEAEPLRCLAKALGSSLEEYVDSLILLRDKYRDTFSGLAEAVIRPAELCGVFRAPR